MKLKQVLIITYYWPPSGGGAVMRWLKFAKYLPEYGWNPIIITPSNPSYPFTDQSLINDIPKSIRVEQVPIWEPYDIFYKISNIDSKKRKQIGQSLQKTRRSILDKLAIFLRGNFLIPDPRIFWVRPVIKHTRNIVRKEKIKIVVTTGPPHSIHLIGLQLKKMLDISWIADFRDPWSEWTKLNELKVTFPVRKIHQYLEKKILKRADKIITVSGNLVQNFKSKTNKEVILIRNGYDENEYETMPQKRINDIIRISYFGTIDDERDPRIFFSALKEVFQELPELKQKIHVLFKGIISEMFVEDVLNDVELSENFRVEGYSPHKEIIQEYSKTDILLFILTKSGISSGYTPGKFFEYMATGIPILALIDSEGEAAQIIKDYNLGIVADPDNKNEIKKAIIELFKGIKSGKINKGRIIPEEFSRKYLTGKLVNVLENCL